jgi:hypothetical protein
MWRFLRAERRKRYEDVWNGWEKGKDGECSTHDIPCVLRGLKGGECLLFHPQNVRVSRAFSRDCKLMKLNIKNKKAKNKNNRALFTSPFKNKHLKNLKLEYKLNYNIYLKVAKNNTIWS